MIASTTPTRLTVDDALARAYVTAVLRAAYRRPALPLDYSTPPVGPVLHRAARDDGGRVRPLDDWGCSVFSDGENMIERDHAPDRPCAQMYFIQYTGSLSGESALWWRKDRPGYTIRVDEAGQYTESEARMIERVRGEAKSFPVDVVLGAASRHVVASDLRKATDVAKVTP